MQGAAQFFQAFAPAVELGAMPLDVAVDIFTGCARVPKLGKQVEDALSRWGQHAQEEAKNPAPPKPDPEMMKIEMQGKMQAQQMQLDQAKTQAQLQADNQKHQADIQFKQQDAQNNMALKRAELEHTITLETTKMRMEQDRKNAEAHHSARIKEMELHHGMQLEQAKQEGEHKLLQSQHDHEVFLKYGEASHKMLSAKHKAAAKEAEKGKSPDAPDTEQMLIQILGQMKQAQAQQSDGLQALAQAMVAPKQVIRDAQGRAVGIAPAQKGRAH